MWTVTLHCWTQSTLRGIPMRGSQRKIPVPQCKIALWRHDTASRLRVLGSKIEPGRGRGTQVRVGTASLRRSWYWRANVVAAMTGLQHLSSMLCLDSCAAILKWRLAEPAAEASREM